MLRQTFMLFAIMLSSLLVVSLLMGLTFTSDVTIFALPIPFILFLATTTTAGVALLNVLRVRRIPYASATNKYSSTQRGSVIVPVSAPAALASVRHYCHDQLWRVVRHDTRQGRLLIQTPPSLWSWGAKIEVITTSREDGLTEVTIESKPRLPTAVIDGGASLANVGRIIELLQERSIAIDS